MPPLAALLIDWVLTAFWPLVGHSGLRHFSGLAFAQAGLFLGVMVLLPWLLREGRLARLCSRELRWPVFWMGFWGTALPSALFITALEYTTPANAAIMAQVEILYSSVLCAWILRERISGTQAAASVLVVAGTGLIVWQDLGTMRWRGDALILVTPWMFQVSHIAAKRLPEDLDAVSIAGGRLLFGGVAMLPLTLWSMRNGCRWSWGAEAALLLGVQGLVIAALNHVLWYVAIRRMDLAKATAIMLSYPALTVLYSGMLGAETIDATKGAGLALTLGGAYWLSLLAYRARPR